MTPAKPDWTCASLTPSLRLWDSLQPGAQPHLSRASIRDAG